MTANKKAQHTPTLRIDDEPLPARKCLFCSKEFEPKYKNQECCCGDHAILYLKGEAQHTPTPWKVNGIDHIFTTNEKLIATTFIDAGMTREDRKANAEHIVRCVNSHDALVGALRDITGEQDVWLMDDYSDVYQCRFCGRQHDYAAEVCESDDCMANKARQALKQAEG